MSRWTKSIILSLLLTLPYPEVAEHSGCAFLVFAAVDGSVDIADGVDAYLDRVIYRELHFPTAPPVASICAAISIELAT